MMHEYLLYFQVNTCKINEYCFAPGDANPANNREVCDPAKSTTSFVKRSGKKYLSCLFTYS